MAKRIMITFPVSEEFRDKIDTYCKTIDKDNELSRAALCRIALKDYMKRNPAKDKDMTDIIL